MKAIETQLDKFKQAARDLECDDDDKRFRERVGNLAVAKPKPPSEVDSDSN